jgi:TonB family protein
VDPVSVRLAEIEGHRPRLLPYLVLATALHIGVAAAFFVVGRQRPQPLAAQLPTVSVRIIREPPRARRSSRPAAARPVATPAPVPTAAPTAAPRPTAPPAPEVPRASADAMPDLATRHTPIPTPAPTGDAGGVGRGGLSLGGGDRAQEAGVPSDFQYTYYLQRMLTLIESRWFKPPVPAGTSARARFTILSEGRIEGIALEQSSGSPSFDRAVLRALYAANPLPPLPPAYRKPSLTVHLTFSHAE